jgi:hypothetical protein
MWYGVRLLLNINAIYELGIACISFAAQFPLKFLKIVYEHAKPFIVFQEIWLSVANCIFLSCRLRSFTMLFKLNLKNTKNNEVFLLLSENDFRKTWVNTNTNLFVEGRQLAFIQIISVVLAKGIETLLIS